ncbi:jg8591 [Pararge aegeria aegeria]|uniref:Jg8591 protein n=1 Tax=Pararge aegeria aegeria TaxID=348720 RepID=A0A8S4RJ97_9NEOP|nr:jg8591 [Pararge aegeria aegeria]
MTPCGDGLDHKTGCHHPSSSRECRTRRPREFNEERAAASSVYLLLQLTAITNPSAQRGDYRQTLPLEQALNPAVNIHRGHKNL